MLLLPDVEGCTIIYCELLKQIGVNAIPINSANPDKVFKGGTKWKD